MEVLESNEKQAGEDPQSPTMLPWDRFSNWIHCCCVVTFDLELGQAMEVWTYNLSLSINLTALLSAPFQSVFVIVYVI